MSVGWLTAADVDELWSDVAHVGQVVPGWRSALVLADPHGEVEALQRRAAAWTWSSLDDAPDRWVASELSGYAEEVIRLVGHLVADRRLPAAVMRNVCANRMAWTLAVHHRLLYETENRLWDVVAERMGPQWLERQRAAFGIDVSHAESCWAATDLFAMTASVVTDVLDPEQQSVVATAVRVAAEGRR